MTALMTTRCPVCRTATAVTVNEVLIDPAARTVTWVCLVCDDLVDRVADGAALAALERAGACRVTRRPPGSRRSGPALGPDDLLALHALLERDDWFGLLVAAHP